MSLSCHPGQAHLVLLGLGHVVVERRGLEKGREALDLVLHQTDQGADHQSDAGTPLTNESTC